MIKVKLKRSSKTQTSVPSHGGNTLNYALILGACNYVLYALIPGYGQLYSFVSSLLKINLAKQYKKSPDIGLTSSITLVTGLFSIVHKICDVEWLHTVAYVMSALAMILVLSLYIRAQIRDRGIFKHTYFMIGVSSLMVALGVPLQIVLGYNLAWAPLHHIRAGKNMDIKISNIMYGCMSTLGLAKALWLVLS